MYVSVLLDLVSSSECKNYSYINFTLHHIVYDVAECTGGCQNGGTCIMPEVCSCTPG